MILVFCLVFVFLWGYLKKFPCGNKLKMILAVTAFSILVSVLVSFPSTYGSYLNSPIPARFSLPFYLETEYGPIYYMDNTGSMWFRIYFTDIEIQEMKFSYRRTGEGSYLYPRGHIDVDYTAHVLFQLTLIFTALNIIGAPLAAFTYKLTDTFTKKLIPKISQFQEYTRKNTLYRWLLPD